MSELITALVTSVYSKDGVVLCDAKGYRVTVNYTSIIVPSRFRYEAHAPKENDKILIQKTDQHEYVLHSVLSKKKNLLPDIQEDEYILKLNEQTKLHFVWTYYDPNDNEVTAENWKGIENSAKYKECNIEIEASEDISITVQGDASLEAGGSVTVDAVGDVSVSSDGDVTIDEGGTPKKVAYQDHTHDYSGTTSDEATYSGTTTNPNEAGTETEIE